MEGRQAAAPAIFTHELWVMVSSPSTDLSLNLMIESENSNKYRKFLSSGQESC